MRIELKERSADVAPIRERGRGMRPRHTANLRAGRAGELDPTGRGGETPRRGSSVTGMVSSGGHRIGRARPAESPRTGVRETNASKRVPPEAPERNAPAQETPR